MSAARRRETRHPACAERRRGPFAERGAHGAALAADRLFARREPRHARPDRHARRDARRRYARRHRRRSAAHATSSSRSTAAISRWRRSSPRLTRPGLPRSSTTRRSSAPPASTWAAARRRSRFSTAASSCMPDAIADRRAACDARRRPRAFDQPCRRGAHQGAARLGAAVDLRRAGHPDHSRRSARTSAIIRTPCRARR